MYISEFKPQAYKTLSNSHGIEIMINNTQEEVLYAYSDEGPNPKIHLSEIEFDQDGEAYFWAGSSVQYLNEFINYK